MVSHACNPSTWEIEAGRFALNLRPALAIQWQQDPVSKKVGAGSKHLRTYLKGKEHPGSSSLPLVVMSRVVSRRTQELLGPGTPPISTVYLTCATCFLLSFPVHSLHKAIHEMLWWGRQEKALLLALEETVQSSKPDHTEPR